MSILDFFTREAGQERRRALEGLLTQFIPPEMRPQLGLLAEANPVVSMERAGQDAETLFAPDQSLMDRLAAGGRMASNMAGVVAPAMVAGRAGVPVANAVTETLTGLSMTPQAAALRDFGADEFGGVGIGAADAAAERGAQIMDMLRSGRAADVTDEMLDMGDPVLNARLNEYLFRNYDLPMDAASRMARAKEAGFGTAAFHGGASDLRYVSQFEGGAEAGRGALYSTSSPRVANTYAAPRNFADTGGNVTPLSVRSDGYLEAGYTAPFPADGTQAEMDAWLSGVDRFNRRLDSGSAKNSYFAARIDAAREKNAPGVVVREVEDNRTAGSFVEPSDVFVSLDPTSLRSRFARFDPRLAHLRNLNAAMVAGVPLGLLAMQPQEEQY